MLIMFTEIRINEEMPPNTVWTHIANDDWNKSPASSMTSGLRELIIFLSFIFERRLTYMYHL